MMIKPVIIMSACLAGVKCRYNGKDKKAIWYDVIEDRYRIIKICPEVLAGMSVPRPAMEFVEGDGESIWKYGIGRVINSKGENVTEMLKKGALLAMEICKRYDAKWVIVKEKSPSCGLYKVFFKDRGLSQGMGMWTYLLLKEGYNVLNEDEFNI